MQKLCKEGNRKLVKKICGHALWTSILCFYPFSFLMAQPVAGLSEKAKHIIPIAAYGHAPDSFADLAEKLLPTVVNISTNESLNPTEQTDDDDENDSQDDSNSDGSSRMQHPPFKKFYNDYMEMQQDQNSTLRQQQALGSGFIIDPSGIIVTNYHVIKNADQITVTLQDNTVLKARMIGKDDRTDLALLKVNPSSPLPVTQFGDSDKERIGDWVLAIGNPYGWSGTVTTGIISSRGRNIDQGPYDDFIQTDAPINRGNSGGPLFNMKGEVIGVNTAIFSPSGGSIGIGFAIPSNEAKTVINQLRSNGRVSRSWIGVKIQEMTSDIAESLGLKSNQGALVTGVEAGSPAEEASLKAGDVILTLNDKKVQARTLPILVAQMPANQKIVLGIWRQGKPLVLNIIIRDMPENDTSTPIPEDTTSKINKIAIKGLGLWVCDINDSLRKKYNLAEKQVGVVIVAIKPGSPADNRSLNPGDVIIGVRQRNITSVANLLKALQEEKRTKRPSALLLLQVADSRYWITLPFSNKK